jgi:hypothetical protein
LWGVLPRSHDHVGNILRIGDVAGRAQTDFGQRIESGSVLLDWREFKAHVPLRLAITGGLSPILALDVIDHGTFHPCQQCRNHQADAFASAGWGKGEDMLGAVMAQVMKPLFTIVVPAADVYALTSVE